MASDDTAAAQCDHDACRIQRGEWNERLARIATFGNIAPCPVHGGTRHKMGEPDATGVCVYCNRTIDRQWWGNGGWLWVHRDTGNSECARTTNATPRDDFADIGDIPREQDQSA